MLTVMAESQLYCDTCDVHLTGPLPAKQHYSGSKHRKKLAQLDMTFSPGAASTTGFGSQTGALDLPDFPSYPADATKPENTLKSAETIRKCSVVMVPSLNPNLPPVPVTMTENSAIPQSEYEFYGDGGTCHLCDVELTSRQHADQHLSGQKHMKAKKLWEMRREQLQMTVSGLDQSMMSKPIAMCQPLVSKLPTEHRISDAVTKHNPISSASVPAPAAEPAKLVDGMQWFSCDVCNKDMNTSEMLDLHKRSSAHQKKVDRQQLAAASIDNTAWVTCPTCQKKLNSAVQLDIHMSNHNRQCLSNCPPARPGGITSPVVARPGDSTVWQICPVCDKRLNSVKQLDIHMRSHCPPGSSVVDDSDTRRNDVSAVYIGGTTSQRTSTADTGAIFEHSNVTLLEAGKISPPTEFCDKFHANLLSGVDHLQLSKGTQPDESWTTPQCTISSKTQQISGYSVTETGSETEFISDADAVAGDVTSENPPKLVGPEAQRAFSENLLSQTTGKAVVNTTAAAAADDDDDDPEITDDDLITTGSCTSVGCAYHCELCDVHLNGEEPKNMHITGAKHISCRQKAEETTSSEHNPFGPHFRYFCELCRVPFNTLKDKRQHERGQQHVAKSVRHVPAPERLIPDVVLPTDTDKHCCIPDSLVTSSPRSYQQELYSKALVADSICFLPTGRHL